MHLATKLKTCTGNRVLGSQRAELATTGARPRNGINEVLLRSAASREPNRAMAKPNSQPQTGKLDTDNIKTNMEKPAARGKKRARKNEHRKLDGAQLKRTRKHEP